MKSYSAEHELMRRRVWIESFKAVANANDCKKPKVAIDWADQALEAFDERFKNMDDS